MSFKTFTHWTPKICLLWIENIFQTHLLLKQPFTFAAFLFSNLIFRLWTTDLTSQTTEVGNNYACRSKCLLLLNLQWYGNIKIILLFFRLFLLMLVTILQTFFFTTRPPKMWPQLCQQEFKLPHWHHEVCTKIQIQLQLVDQTHFFLLLFRNFSISLLSLDIDSSFFTLYPLMTKRFWQVCTLHYKFKSEKFQILCQ